MQTWKQALSRTRWPCWVAWVLMTGCALPSTSTTPLSPSAGYVARIDITHRAPAFGGQTIDGVGAYEQIAGVAHLRIDPRHPANQGIVDLDRVPRAADGWVDYQTDVLVVRPVDAKRASGVSVFEIANRGNKIFIPRMNDAAAPQVDTAAMVGHGWGLRQGHVWVWAGWQGDIKPGVKGASIGTNFPVAKGPNGQTIVGLVEEEAVFDDDKKLSPMVLTHPASRLTPDNGRLRVRSHASAPAIDLPSTAWKYLNAHSIELQRSAQVDNGAIYSFTYEAQDPKVNGLGLSVLRDVTRYFKTSTESVLADIRPQTNVVVGISQSGRFLRDFLWYGFNADPRGGRVFDAAMSFISGSRKSFVNARFSQPGRYSRQHEDHEVYGGQFPFSYAVTLDPVTGQSDGIFARCERDQTCPKLMHVDSTLEFWQARASLVVVDAAGKAVPVPDNVRLYTMASTQHSAPPVASAGVCQTLNNPAQQFATYRVLFDHLVKWTQGKSLPPASQFPTLANAGLVWPTQAAMGFPDLSGWGVAFPQVINELQVIDYASGLPQVDASRRYPIYVPRVNVDGHDVVGVSLPDVGVPLATYSGFNLRKAGFAPGQLCGLNGLMVPLAATQDERMQKRDTRPSLAERYPNKAVYVQRTQAFADEQVRKGLLLAEDAERFVRQAQAETRVK